MIKSKHQKTRVLISHKDIRKWIINKERSQTSNQRVNEKQFGNKLESIFINPNEVLSAIDIHHQQKDCKIYIKNQKPPNGP